MNNFILLLKRNGVYLRKIPTFRNNLMSISFPGLFFESKQKSEYNFNIIKSKIPRKFPSTISNLQRFLVTAPRN